MKIAFQLLLYCLLFFLLLKATVRDDGRRMLYFYPEAYQKKATEIGLADEETLRRKRTAFMVPFVLILLAVLVSMIVFWNRVTDFRTAYLESLLFLEVMNWFDGMLDRVWIAHSRIWIIPEMEGMPYVNSWAEVLRKRLLGTILFIAAAVPAAGICVLTEKLVSA